MEYILFSVIHRSSEEAEKVYGVVQFFKMILSCFFLGWLVFGIVSIPGAILSCLIDEYFYLFLHYKFNIITSFYVFNNPFIFSKNLKIKIHLII